MHGKPIKFSNENVRIWRKVPKRGHLNQLLSRMKASSQEIQELDMRENLEA